MHRDVASEEEATAGHRWPGILSSLRAVCGEEDLLAAQAHLLQFDHERVAEGAGSETGCKRRKLRSFCY